MRRTVTSAPSASSTYTDTTAAVVESQNVAPACRRIRLLGFRSSTAWHQALAWAFFAALFVAFVLTMFPPVVASNHDVLVYKAIRLLIFATPLLCVVLLSDFSWCKHIPLFSSERRLQRFLGAATLTALMLCLCANLMYLHTPEYRTALQQHAVELIAGSQQPSSGENETTADNVPSKNVVAPAVDSSSDDNNESLGDAWRDQREGCDTD